MHLIILFLLVITTSPLTHFCIKLCFNTSLKPFFHIYDSSCYGYNISVILLPGLRHTKSHNTCNKVYSILPRYPVISGSRHTNLRDIRSLITLVTKCILHDILIILVSGWRHTKSLLKMCTLPKIPWPRHPTSPRHTSLIDIPSLS